MLKRKLYILLAALILILFIINYPFLDKKVGEFLLEHETANVVRIIDGDTIVVEYNKNDTSVRLLGINTPEKNEPYYSEAKQFLENLILNKTIELEKGKENKDKYGRLLRYVFLKDENINLKIIEEGFANYYFPSGKDPYYSAFKKAWEKCLSKNVNLCESSKDVCSKCIELKEFYYKSQEIILYNDCSFDCNLEGWQIKHEGRKKFLFHNFILKSQEEVIIKVENKTNTEDVLFWNEENVFAKTGDTLFLRDGSGKLVLWESY